MQGLLSQHSSLYRAPLVLSILCLLSTGALALLNIATRDKITEAKARSRLSGFVTLLSYHADSPPNPAPSASRPESRSINELSLRAIGQGRPVPDSELVRMLYHVSATDTDTKTETRAEANIPELYVLQLAGHGFGGPLELLAAYRPDGRLYHAVMLDNTETPGFGKKAENPGYMEMFRDRGSRLHSEPEQSIPTTKRALAVPYLDAVTGSTISFRAISSALLAGADWLVTRQARQTNGTVQ
ncbi:FMN-binding protein [Candidatus Haliotispira prima]|uniref:FMN-binding protein n=1 Tax=Candidatus Haliotispira prima TaxID=3034016 RepID=A0ABY8MDZ6_9SPIO|nr:FMN-binding protein [Candidatus Haliotispira prima]